MSKQPKNRERATIQKEPIKIRYKQLADGNQSIYLDYYKNGKRKYEFLNLYLIPEKTKQDKNKNEATKDVAIAVQSERIVAIQNNKYGFTPKGNNILLKSNLIDYIDNIAEEHLSNTGNKHGEYYNFRSLKLHLKNFRGENIPFSMIDDDFAESFVDYLRSAKNQNLHKNKETPYLSQNTQNKLFKKLNTALKRAVTEKIITGNPLQYISDKKKPKAESGTREYLTIKEVKKLIKTDCKNEDVKRSFLFCCLTGLRFSDISKLKWGDIRENDFGGYQMGFTMKKGKKSVVIQVSDAAMAWLPERKDAKPNDKIFRLSKNELVNPILSDWVNSAGINKKITFHCSRHTAATINLSLGVPIAVVSKLMGHSKIATTEIYAKIVNDAQRKAVNKQNGIFGNKTKRV